MNLSTCAERRTPSAERLASGVRRQASGVLVFTHLHLPRHLPSLQDRDPRRRDVALDQCRGLELDSLGGVDGAANFARYYRFLGVDIALDDGARRDDNLGLGADGSLD